jgi:hypothetical protein
VDHQEDGPLFVDHSVRLINLARKALQEERFHVDFRPIIHDLLDQKLDASEDLASAIQASPQLLAAIAEDASEVSEDFLRDSALSDQMVSRMIPWNDGLEMLPSFVGVRLRIQNSIFASLTGTTPGSPRLQQTHYPLYSYLPLLTKPLSASSLYAST